MATPISESKTMHGARRSALIAISLSVILTIAGCVAFLREVRTLLRIEEKQQKMQLVIRSMRACMDDMQDMETGQRGYLLTGKREYLTPFDRGAARFSDNLNELRYRVEVAVPEDKQMPVDLARLARAKKNELVKTIQLRESGHLQQAVGIVNSDEGRHHMEQIRSIIDAHIGKYNERITGIKAEIDRHLHVASTLFVLWICAIGALIASALWNVRYSHRLLRTASEQLAVQAMHDPLTHLPNRRYLNDWLNKAIARAGRLRQPVGALYIDLDGFSEINNQLGHEAGDHALKWACEVFRNNVRDSDFLARLGGDEFVVICCDQTIEQLSQLSQRLIAMMETSSPSESLPPGALSASIGIALTNNPSTSAAELIRQADGAMYAAKDAGKRCYRVAA
ncbi:MAG TPA: diguanylate cyclase [Herminiimonas sp.]|nr:diguanylate cyclase [Herminiimonas sp.]